MTNQDHIKQYKNGLITFQELQKILNKSGYQLKDGFGINRYYLLPLK